MCGAHWRQCVEGSGASAWSELAPVRGACLQQWQRARASGKCVERARASGKCVVRALASACSGKCVVWSVRGACSGQRVVGPVRGACFDETQLMTLAEVKKGGDLMFTAALHELPE